MTYVIGVRCDICGELVTVPYTGQQHKLPKGWAHITVNYTHIENGPTHQMREICEACAKGLESGESVEIYKARQQYAQIKKGLDTVTPIISPKYDYDPRVVPLADKDIYGVDEEEASR